MSERIYPKRIVRHIGDRAACRVCGSDIEWHGALYGWVDRGSNRWCDRSGQRPVDADGVLGKYPHRYHRPTE